MYKVNAFLDNLACDLSPWSCPNFRGADEEHREHVIAATTSSTGHTTISRLDPQPLWADEIMALLQNEGSIDDDDDGLVIFVNSYFLDHSNHRHHDRPRPLRFDADVTEWTRDIDLSRLGRFC